MWSYYGSKSKIVKKYPHPKFDTIIEPFAGSARYALLHWENDIILVDKYDAIVRLWKYLQLCSNNDILSLPKVSAGDNLKDIETLSLEEKTLMGFLINPGSSTPKNVVSRTFGNGKMEERVERDKISIASNLHKIKHFRVFMNLFKEKDVHKFMKLLWGIWPVRVEFFEVTNIKRKYQFARFFRMP